MNFLTSKTNVCIATFAPRIDGRRLATNGMIEPLLDYFVPKVRKVALIEQPYPGSDELVPRIVVYKNKKLSIEKKSSVIVSWLNPFLKIYNYDGTHVVFKIRDLLSVFDYGLRDKDKFSYFIGLEAINALAGIVLRKFGKVERVIYYVSDYSPVRYGDGFFNKLYLWLDRFCVEHSDVTWDVSPAMLKARYSAGLKSDKKHRVIHVPNALYPSQIGSMEISKRDKNSVVFIGTLDNLNGVDLAIKAIKEVRIKYPDIKFHIIGGTKSNLLRLQLLVKRLKIEENVIFYGFVHKATDMARIIRSCYIGLAPYRAYASSERWYGDAGKIRSYLASGLPVVTTHVPPLGRLIVDQGAGLLVKDNISDISSAVIRLLSDQKLYNKMASAAKKISRTNTWDNVYSKAILDSEKFFQ